MDVSDFDYELPEHLVAQEPVEPRDASRLLVVPKGGGAPRHLRFSDLPELLAPGDLLVLNDRRVIPARLLGRKESGGRCEILLVEPLDAPGARAGGPWRQSSKPLREGSRLAFGGLGAWWRSRGGGVLRRALRPGGPVLARALEREGRVPLPPYIRREPTAADRDRYQTVVAREPGSAAAPTAGLHFTAGLLGRLAERGVVRTTVTLHVGPGTFLPVRTEDARGTPHARRAVRRPEEAAAAFARRESPGGPGRRGGNDVRPDAGERLRGRRLAPRMRAGPSCSSGPGHSFRAVDALITNFHLPRSTLLTLVCAFGGTRAHPGGLPGGRGRRGTASSATATRW